MSEGVARLLFFAYCFFFVYHAVRMLFGPRRPR